ncbi:hypothetical protein GIB67_040526 [Kingdonia uniflora]|uniref:Uncharacterized protein n=1 Tax=Kingdonia uniflora TaxID=39325 RepID=A0A7J7L5H6_9MAGN|nr:hypothetical protein GIB67_040526 [Kingdonia uniflora]
MDYQDNHQISQSPQYDCLLFDIDDTLYPLSSGIAAECRKNIQEYMLQKLGIEENKISEMCALLYKAYGTTMAGLRAIGYEFDYDEFHGFVHGRLPYEKLKPDPVLRSLLLSLPHRKVHFSQLNAASELPKTQIFCKPSEAAIEKALKIADINPQKTIFFDDNIRNILSGKDVGLHTVHVGTSHKSKGADFALESIHNIKEALPELWEADEKSENMTYSHKVAIETYVKA